MLIAALFAFFFTKAVATVTGPGEGERSREVKPLPRRQMVSCATCGVYVLRERAYGGQGDVFYCSSNCALA